MDEQLYEDAITFPYRLAIFDSLRSILHNRVIDVRVQYMIEVAFHVRKDKFAAFPAVIPELDLIEDDDQIMHTITLDDAQDPENTLSIPIDPLYAACHGNITTFVCRYLSI